MNSSATEMRKRTVKDIFESYEFAHKKLNEDFSLFKEKIESEILIEDEHMVRLMELSSLISTEKLDNVKKHLGELGSQVQEYIGDYQEKVEHNNKLVDDIYEKHKGSLFEVCEIKRIVDDLDTEICKFLHMMDRAPGNVEGELLYDTYATKSDKWQALEQVNVTIAAPSNMLFGELRFALLERPYVKAMVGDAYEPKYVDEPSCNVQLNGTPLRVREVTVVEGADMQELVIAVESNVMAAGSSYELSVGLDCTANVIMAHSSGGAGYVPVVRVLGCAC